MAFKKLGFGLVVFAMALSLSSKAEAALLTLADGADTWTLNITTGCTTCAVELKVVFGDPAQHTGDFISAVQWSIEPPTLMPQSAGNIGFTGTTAGGTWTFDLANLNANDCSGGSNNQACGDRSLPGSAVVDGGTFIWNFQTTFGSQLGTLTTGNIRASYNNADSSPATNFSPGGGTFTPGGGGGSPITVVPEPASLLLLGTGLTVIAARARNRFRKQS